MCLRMVQIIGVHPMFLTSQHQLKRRVSVIIITHVLCVFTLLLVPVDLGTIENVEKYPTMKG